MRRTHLRGSGKIREEGIFASVALIHVGAFNPGLVMRKLIGYGTPRGLQGGGNSVCELVAELAFWILFIQHISATDVM